MPMELSAGSGQPRAAPGQGPAIAGQWTCFQFHPAPGGLEEAKTRDTGHPGQRHFSTTAILDRQPAVLYLLYHMAHHTVGLSLGSPRPSPCPLVARTTSLFRAC